MRFDPVFVSSMISVAIGLTFGYAALAKLKDMRQVVEGIRGFDMIPRTLAPFAAAMLVLVEGAVAVSHIGGVSLSVFVPLTVILLVAFLGVSVVLLKRRPGAPCLCFGANAANPIGTGTIYRLICFLVAEVTLLILVAQYGSAPITIHDTERLVLVATALVFLLWAFSTRDVYVWFRAVQRENRLRKQMFD